VTVVDCANFARLNNFSRTAKIQAKCTDLVLLNKVELAGEVLIDEVLDDLHEVLPALAQLLPTPRYTSYTSRAHEHSQSTVTRTHTMLLLTCALAVCGFAWLPMTAGSLIPP